jgi:predicted DsbA family dithiol-disulfide isomerase
MTPIEIQVWSDIVCPWCAIGLTHLDEAIAAFEGPVDVIWRSFELDPTSPRVTDESLERALGRKYGRPPHEIDAMMARVAAMGARRGLRLDFANAKPGNTFDAHRLLHLARAHGVQNALKRRLFQGYFSEGIAIGDPDALRALAASAGLSDAAVVEVLSTDRYADAVRADEAAAHDIGIQAVPTYVLNDRLAVSGAQPVEVLLGALAEVGREIGP